MKIIFLTIGGVKNVNQSGVYTDLLRYFHKNGHQVYVVSQLERRQKQKTFFEISSGINILRVKTGNITKTKWFEKGISTLLLPFQYYNAINKFWNYESFDLILYSTPPITLDRTVVKLKNRDHAFSYLMLKDIFPQNAVDLGILKKKGVKGIVYKLFRRKEKHIYNISDKIGCMSPANVHYVLKNNPQLEADKLELCPNTIDSYKVSDNSDKSTFREKYKLPQDKMILLYGGNFGKPQNVDFIIDVLQEAECFSILHFVMCGSGTDFYKLTEYFKNQNPTNVSIIDAIPFHEYTELLRSADVGLIFLDYHFTIPNFPSRLVDYMNYSLPVFAATDEATDLGKIIQENQLGWWCKSDSTKGYISTLQEIINTRSKLKNIGKHSKEFMEQNFSTECAYHAIINSYQNWKDPKNV